MQEIWKDIKGYEGYQVSNLGRIRTFNKITYTKKHGRRYWKNKILKYKSKNTTTGYRIDLWKDGKPKTFLVARLVATTFLEDLINTDMTVNHKDGNRFNNNINNLEWCTRKENIQYGFENHQYPQKEITLYNTMTNKEYTFRSLALGSTFLGRNKGYICNCIINNRKISDKNNIEYIIKKKH